ncbi:Calcium-Transporting Atpase Type 2C Member 2 [Manis pentadactyla]|nr:Calcium-Transporting Atpase Type 2C Member 2 [Manis pentadactyla]
MQTKCAAAEIILGARTPTLILKCYCSIANNNTYITPLDPDEMEMCHKCLIRCGSFSLLATSTASSPSCPGDMS